MNVNEARTTLTYQTLGRAMAIGESVDDLSLSADPAIERLKGILAGYDANVELGVEPCAQISREGL